MPEIEQNNFASMLKLEIMDKKMKAFLEVKAPTIDQTISITSTDIKDFLLKEGIVFGVNHGILDEIVEGQKWGERFLVAVGTFPSPGDDAAFEFLFPTDKSFKPQISENGHIDYREISIVNSVAKDSVLVKKVPAKMGPAGMDIYGSEIPPITGKDASIQVGSGAYRDPADNLLIKASFDGIIYYDSNKNYLEVQKLFSIKESVDFSTGNVNVKSSVEIKGDVNPGFSVKSPYDVQINGTVEQAVITCDGTLKVGKGIVGDGKQVISVGKDLHAGFINNQNIKCKGSLYVANEIRNSNIECGGEIVIVKNTGVILGGKIFVTNKMTAASIGNKYNVTSEIFAGVVLEYKEKYDLKKADIMAVHKLIATFNKKMAEISHQSPNSNNSLRVSTLQDEHEGCLARLDILNRELSEIEKLYFSVNNPYVAVTKTVYPGTIIKIKNAVYEVKDELTNVKFSIVNDEIVCTKLK